MNTDHDSPTLEPAAPAPGVRAWWPGHGVLVVTAESHWLDSGQPATVEVQSQALADWRAALKSAVSLARLTEPLDPTGARVTLRLELLPEKPTQVAVPDLEDAHSPVPPATPDIGRGLAEAAAVLADRAARGLLGLPPAGAWVLAHCREWELGALQALPEPWQSRSLTWLRRLAASSPAEANAGAGAAMPRVIVAAPAGLPADAPPHWQALSHLCQMQGQLHHRLAPECRVRSFEAWFPTVGACGAQLASVRVVVTPAEPTLPGAVEVLGTTDREKIRRALAVLACVRRLDAHAARWRTLVHFSTGGFDGRSFELALAVADRIARGREWPGAGRVLATGAIDDRTGAVLTVEEGPPQPQGAGLGPPAEQGAEGKLELLKREVRLYDTVLLPKAWDRDRPGSGDNRQHHAPMRFDHLPPSAPFARPQVVYVTAVTH